MKNSDKSFLSELRFGLAHMLLCNLEVNNDMQNTDLNSAI
jgi:hypothetical protein